MLLPITATRGRLSLNITTLGLFVFYTWFYDAGVFSLPHDKGVLCSQPTFPFLLRFRAGHRGFPRAVLLLRTGLWIRALCGDRSSCALRGLCCVLAFLLHLCKARGGLLQLRGDPAELQEVRARRGMAEVFRLLSVRVSLAQSEIARNWDFWTLDGAGFGNNAGVRGDLWGADFLDSFIRIHAAVALFLYAL